jgi:hypothetical protein
LHQSNTPQCITGGAVTMAAVMNGNVQGIQIGAKSRPAVDVAN